MSRGPLLSLLLAAAVLAAAGFFLRGYTTDDTFIHLRYAENLLERGEFSFNPGERSYGATSPLWIFGLALLLTLGAPPLLAAWLLGALCGLLVVLLIWSMVGRLELPPAWGAAVLLLAAGDVWFLRWSFSGMETPLATALLLVMVWPLIHRGGLPAGPGVWRLHLAWGVAAGLAALTRPEFMVIVPLAWPWLTWAGGGGSRSAGTPLIARLGAAVAGWLVVMGPWLAYAWSAFGRLTPGTASAKSAAATLDPLVMGGYLWQSAKVLGLTQGVMWLALAALAAVLALRNRLPAPGVDASAAPAFRRDVALAGIAMTWAAALMGGYAAKQVWIISRYICPLAPVLLLAAAVLARRLAAGSPGGTRVAASILGPAAIVTLAVNAAVFTDQVVPHARTFPLGIKECYVGMGEWIRDNAEQDAVVAALDIGAVGYASGRRVLDLMGLVSPEVLAVGLEMGFQDMVTGGAWLEIGGGDDSRPDYFIDRSEGEPRWEGRTVRGVRFELLDTCEIAGVGLREPQPWTVALYRLIPSETRTRPSAGG
ncbi:MAG: hypothetical protein AB7V45_06295 [Candidatus Krumholzibacteriia bacterium]